MPSFNPGLVPTIPAGRLWTRFVIDPTLNVRWLVATDPVYFEAMNRPIADVALRTLILAKAVDSLSSSLGHQTLYPFLVQPKIASGTDQADVPPSWIWDMSIAIPRKWEKLRLARIKRLSGTNDPTNYTGQLKVLFSANVVGSTTETVLLIANYTIDSALAFQIQPLRAPTANEEIGGLGVDEGLTVAGYVCFRTLSPDEVGVADFLDLVAPPDPPTDSNNDGYYDVPATYEMVDSPSGGQGSGDDFSFISVTHGTGLISESAQTPLPNLNADLQTWLDSFNFPFDASANRTSTIGIQLPQGLFREFNICVPAGDEPTGATTGAYFPVWMSRVELIGSGHIRVYFSTHNATETETGGTPSLTPVEFASMDLFRSYTPGEVVEIVPAANLQNKSGVGWGQHFGRGHAVLSSIWDNTTTIGDFFGAFNAILDSPQDTDFPQSSGRLSCFGLSRVPKYTPTIGQARALLGSTSRLNTPLDPGADNRYVTEGDIGMGNTVDLDNVAGITPHPAIKRYGFTGSLLQRTFYLEVDTSNLGTDPLFYEKQILPRIRSLLGRDPVFADRWFNGISFRTFNGDTWQD